MRIARGDVDWLDVGVLVRRKRSLGVGGSLLKAGE